MASVKIHKAAGAPGQPATEGPEVAPATPSAQLVRQALKEELVTDAKGRKILMRKPSVLAQFRIVEAVGPQVAANQTYMQMINPLIYVGAIDGVPVALPTSLLETEALIARLDDEGLNAAMSWYVANVISPTLEAIQAEEAKARLKN
jgi:hypothetical protein